MKITPIASPLVASEGARPGYIGVDINPAAFGAASAQANIRAAESGRRTADQSFDTAMVAQGLKNETIAKEADVEATQKLMDLQFNPQTGYYSKKGRNAVEAYEDTLNATRNIRQETLDSLPNEQAKRMFDQVFLRRLQYSMEGIASHASRENLQWMTDTSNAREQTLASEGALHWNDMKHFSSVTIPAVAAEAKSRSEMLGYSDESTRLEVQTAIDKAHITRLATQVRQDPIGAIKSYGDVANSLSAQGKIKAEEVVMGGVRLAHEQEAWARQNDIWVRQQNDETINQGFFTLFKDHKLTPDIVDRSGLSAPQKIGWASRLKEQEKTDNRLEVNNPATAGTLLRRVFLPYGDPNKITDPNIIYGYAGNGISVSLAESLGKIVADARTAEGRRVSEVRSRFFNNVKAQFRQGPEGHDPVGDHDFFRFTDFIISKEETLKGDKKDPYDLYNPNSPLYAGNYIDQFKATLKQRLERDAAEIRRGMGPAVEGAITKVVPKMEGETPDAYLQRVEGKK